MSNPTSQRLTRLYREFADTEVAFNAQVILESGLITSEVHLTVGSERLHCVLYACSMKGARVIVETGHDNGDRLSRQGGLQLHLAFKTGDAKAPISFFVGCRVESLSEYNPQRPRLRFATLEFTQKAPEVLVEVLGGLLEIKANAARRRDQRVVVTPEVLKQIGLQTRDVCLAIDGTSRRCLLRDLSFGGAKVLLSALGLPSSPGRAQLKLQRCEVPDPTVLDGSIIRVEDVLGRDDLVALSIKYSSDPPISYKQKINNVFSHL